MIGLILDHNGVVCNGNDFYKVRSQRLAKVLNVKWTEEFMAYWKKLYIEASLGKISLDEYYDSISTALNVRLNGDEDDKFVSMEEIIPEIKKTLRSLRRNPDVKIALLSNYVDTWVYNFLDSCNLRKYFHAVIVSSAIKIRKPDAEAYKIAASEIDVPLSRCIYVGDSVIDLEACKKIGIRPVFIPGEETDSKGFEKIENVGDLVRLIE